MVRRIAGPIIVLLVLPAIGPASYAQEPRPQPYVRSWTIPESIAKGAVSKTGGIPSGLLGGAGPSFANIVQMADVIATGIVGVGHSYLSDDETDIYTDYPLSDVVILYPAGFFETTSRPGQATPAFGVTLLGGTAVVNGVPFTQNEPSLGPLRAGMQGLFLLQRRNSIQKETKYLIAGGLPFFGAFDITENHVTPLMAREDFFLDVRGKLATDVIATVLQLRQRQ